MPVDPRVQPMIEKMLETGCSAEEACRDSPELLAEVVEAWRKLRAIEDQIGELFPEPGSTEDNDA